MELWSRIPTAFMEGVPWSHRRCRSWRRCFRQISDPRKARGVRHPFQGIVSLVFLGLLARITEMAVVVRWAAAHWDELKERLGFTRDKPPCDTTISRALAGLSLDEFRQAFSYWLKTALADQQGRWVAAVDGKTCRQGLDADGSPVQMLNVFLQQVKLTLDQWSIGGDKTNEPGSLKRHLAELLAAYPALQLLTGDAIYAQRPLLELLQEQGCDYLFQVKANQPDVLDALKTCFAEHRRARPAHEVTEKRGDTVETRRLWVNLDDAEYLRERLNVPDCQIAIRVDREVRSAEGALLSRESRYFVTSLDPGSVTAAELHAYIRGHWQVENCLHFVKDRWWDEDRHYTKRPGLAEAFASLTNAALSVLRLIHPPDRPLRATAESIQWRPGSRPPPPRIHPPE